MIRLVFAFGINMKNRDFIFGNKNGLPWYRIEEDLQQFKINTSEIINGQTPIIVMGSKTFESLPKELPNRIHYVLTSKKKENTETVKYFNDLEELKETCIKQEGLVSVIGGTEMLNQFKEIADEAVFTYIMTKKKMVYDKTIPKEVMRYIFDNYSIKGSELFYSDDYKIKRGIEIDWKFVMYKGSNRTKRINKLKEEKRLKEMELK